MTRILAEEIEKIRARGHNRAEGMRGKRRQKNVAEATEENIVWVNSELTQNDKNNSKRYKSNKFFSQQHIEDVLSWIL